MTERAKPMTPNSRDELLGQEDWREVAGFGGTYLVSRSGEVFSRKADRQLTPVLSKGYRRVSLRGAAGRLHRTVHSLVAEAFHGPRPTGMHCAHLDGNPENNAAPNLKWVSQTENEAHKRLHGTANVGQRSHHAKLTDEQVGLLRKGATGKLTRAEWARLMGISERSLFQILRGETYDSAPSRQEPSPPFGDHHTIARGRI